MREYELTLVIDPNLKEEVVNQIIEKVKDEMISKGAELKGGITRTRKKKLSYRIKGKKEAIYITIGFQGNKVHIERLNYILKLNENVLRFLIVKK